jgi:hypothetical protein
MLYPLSYGSGAGAKGGRKPRGFVCADVDARFYVPVSRFESTTKPCIGRRNADSVITGAHSGRGCRSGV